MDIERPSEQLASGQYEGKKEDLLKGFRLFQKKYAYKNVIIQLMLVVIAIGINVVNILTAKDGDVGASFVVIFFCLLIGINCIITPKRTYNKLSQALDQLEGAVYGADVFTDKVIISTLYDPLVKGKEDKESEEEGDGKDLPPATLIHTDNGGVEMLEAEDMYIIYIRKVNVYVIPKSAFSDGENKEIHDRYQLIMGTRYKVI
ncbi:MAG: YcxB family protein [Oscillospiraceae bacterium]|nr:YcxB family protein [Oscillospiraceae bacterium]